MAITTLEQAIQAIEVLQSEVARTAGRLNNLQELSEEQLTAARLALGQADKACEFARNMYRVDHYGYLWKWNTETHQYEKTTSRICTPVIADEAVTTEKLAVGAITTDKIADDAVTTEKIGNGEVKTRNIGPDAITNDKIGAGEVKSRNIGAGEVKSRHIEDGAVTTAKIGAGEVKSINIDERAVITEKLSGGLIDGVETPPAVTEDKIASGAVTTDKLSDITSEAGAAVTESKIAAGAVTEGKIGAGAVTATKIAAGAVLHENLGAEAVQAGNIANGAVENDNIANNAVTSVKIAANAVTTEKLSGYIDEHGVTHDAAVTSAKIATGAVTTAKIGDGEVQENHLASGAVTTAKLADGMISEVATITDAHPVEGSVKPIQSGGVQEALLDRAIVGDIVGDPADEWVPGTAEAYIDQRINEQNNLVNTRMNRQDTIINATNNTVQSVYQAVELLNGSEVIVVADHTSVSSPDSQKIYREQGTTTYTDWMYQGGAWKEIATYEFPGIDDEPVAGSEKLMNSGGIYNTKEDIDNRIYCNYFDGVGNNSGLSYIVHKGVIPNHTYRVSFQNDWDSSEITGGNNKLTIGYNDGEGHTLYTVTGSQQISLNYDVTVPDGTDRIFVGLRANTGVRVWVNIYDVTDVNRIGDIITSTANATKRRTNSGSSSSSDTGNRYTMLFPVKAGDYLQCNSVFDNVGVYVAVWDTVAHAFQAGATGRLQQISGGAFLTDNISGFIEYEGYLGLRFKKSDESSITDAEIETIEESLTLRLSTAMMGKSAEVSEQIVSMTTNKHDDLISDIDFADKDGNVILRVYDGNIKTKNFDSKEYAKGNYNRRIPFTHNVDTHNFLKTNFVAQDINTYEQPVIYQDNCVLYLPESYKSAGKPTKLIIFCKQGASTIESDSDTILSTPNTARVFRYLMYLGYAILAADGVPNGWASAIGIGERAVGNYVAVQSTIKAFDYVIKNYNIDSEAVFIWGYSQGGHYAQNVIDNSTIPFAAAAELSPVCSMRYHQWDLSASVTVGGVTFDKGGRLNIARIFDYPAVSTNAELEALEYDASKTKGYDPWERNVEDIYTGFVQNSNGLWKLPTGTSVDDIVMKKHIRCPIKIWAAENDSTLSADVMKVFIKAVKNAGQTADLQLFTSGGHSIPTNQTSIGSFVENGETVDLYPIAKDVALWFYCFGGYDLK